MPRMLKRLGKFALWAVPILLVTYGAVKLADFAWYRFSAPAAFSANWSGKWDSQMYFIGGRLLVQLPDPIPEGVDFQAEALVYYPIYSVWKTGQFVPMTFTGHLGNDGASSGGQTQQGIPVPVKFKGSAGSQTVEYSALLDNQNGTIRGSYVSQGPADLGTYWLQRD